MRHSNINQRTLEVIVMKLVDHLRMKIIKCKDCNGRHDSCIPSRISKPCDTCKNTGIDVVEKPDKL